MTLTAAYRLTIAIPVVLGAGAIALAALLGDKLEQLGRFGAVVGETAVMAGAATGPFGLLGLLFFGFLCAWSRARDVGELRRVLLVSPVIYLALLILSWIAIVRPTTSGSWLESAEWFGWLGSFVIGIGYASVALGAGLIVVLRRMGVVDTAA